MEEVAVTTLPDCDICKHREQSEHPLPAKYDGKTRMGPWAYMCEDHFQVYGVGLGLGAGQRLVLASQPRMERMLVQTEEVRPGDVLYGEVVVEAITCAGQVSILTEDGARTTYMVNRAVSVEREVAPR